MRQSVFISFLAIAIGLTTVETSKILVIPFGLYSHINLMTKLSKPLKDDGHEVWMLAYDKFENAIREKGLVPLTFPLKPGDDIFPKIEEWSLENPAEMEGTGLMKKFGADPWWGMAFSRVCDSIMQNGHLMATIERQKFDLVVHDGSDIVHCHLMIPYRFDIPFVTVIGFQVTSWVSGVTGLPSIEPEIFRPFSNRMNFWERLENFEQWMEKYNTVFYDIYSHHMDNYCPPHKKKIPLKKLAEMSEIYFMNFEVMCLDYPRVSAPNLIYLSTSSASPTKPLPADLESYINSAKHGVIVMSLGSVKGTQYVWKLLGKKIFDAFARLPQRVIVQYRFDEVFPNVPSNVKLLKWLPQNDILGHRNVKLFINHGGNNGQGEAIYHGVPMLTIPIWLDQMYGGKRIEAHAYGKYVVDKMTVTSDELYEMMTEIINNKTYSENVKKCSEIIHSMPTSQEKFLFWVNHILRFGGGHLRPPSLDMPLYQVLMLDIFAYYALYYLAIVLGVLFVLLFLLKFSQRMVSNSNKAKKE